MILVDPDHPPTMSELMSHTAGFTYGFFGDTPVDHMYRDAKIFESKNLKEFIDKLAAIPLTYQPGKGWTYSVSMDIEGYIVEKLSGQSLPDFMRDNIYKPLGMKDAGFYVPARKTQPVCHAVCERQGRQHGACRQQRHLPGSDYCRAARHAVGRRRHGLDRRGLLSFRIDARQRRRTGRQSHPCSGDRKADDGESSGADPADRRVWHRLAIMRPGFGYGYNGAVEFDPLAANLPDGQGTFTWDGAAGTWFWVDPTNDVVFIGMIQRMYGKGSPTWSTRAARSCTRLWWIRRSRNPGLSMVRFKTGCPRSRF